MFLPLADPLLVEGMLGHSGSIQPIYWLANFILYYALMGSMLLFGRSMKLAIFFFHGLVTRAALVDYYVYKLRGMPFRPQDIRSIFTAVQVIGGYTFDIKPSSAAIYLSVMVSLFLRPSAFRQYV